MSRVQILQQRPTGGNSGVRKDPFTGPIAWTRDTLSPEDGLIRPSEKCLAELDGIVAILRRNSLQLELLTPDQFDLPSCNELMQQAKYILDRGVGFVIIDRLPTTKYSIDESKAVYWVLMQLLERPVAQDKDGQLIYDVRDTGQQAGNGIRGVLTNVGQPVHTDNNFNICAPEYVSLLCLQTAMEGGLNCVVSFYSVYNELLRHHPKLLPRLYQSFLFDRQREHAPGEPMVISHPIIEYDGSSLACRVSYRQVINGYKLAAQPLDSLGKEALETFQAILEDPKFQKDCIFEPGQIQIVSNTGCGHRRTAFNDYADPARKRHLVRLWLRGKGRRFYNG